MLVFDIEYGPTFDLILSLLQCLPVLRCMLTTLPFDSLKDVRFT